MQLFKLGKEVIDTATNRKGMLIHCQIDLNRSAFYNFQPKGLNPKTGAPLKGSWIATSRIKNGELVDVFLPVEALESIATDKASGFKGTVTAITLHISGCVHMVIQSKGTQENGSSVDSVDFDMRRLSGSKIPKLTEKQIQKDQKKKPSPAGMPSITPTRM